MPFILPLNTLREILASTLDPPLYARLAEKTREFACQLYEPFPGTIINKGDLTPSFARAYLDDLCSDQTLPPPPVSPYIGGQCECVPYNVTVTRPFSDPSVPPAPDITVSFVGRVKGLRHVYTPAMGGFPPNVRSFVDYYECSGGVETGNIASKDAGTSTGATITPDFHDTFFISNVVRTDGQPDSCGDPPIGYPDNIPSPVDLTFNFTLNLNDGGDMDFTIIYDPSPDGFPMKFDINGIKVEVNLIGFQFNFSGIDANGNPNSLPGDNNSVLPAPKDDKLRNFKPPVLPEPNDEDYEEDVKDVTDPKEEVIGEEIAFIKVTVTSTPTNIKNQFGNGAPDVNYCGWFEFQADGHNFPRQPIHFINNIYFRPVGATGYAYTLYNGVEGFATTYTLKAEE